jgi:hypothetical protein
MGTSGMNILTRAFAGLVALLALAGCNTLTTDKPIGAAPETEMDARLVGAWKFLDLPSQKESMGHAYGFFLPEKDNAGFRVVAAVWPDKLGESGDDITLDGLTGKAGKHWFLNIKHIVTDGKPEEHEAPGYQMFLYRFDADGTLRLFGVSDAGFEKLEADVDRGRIEGVVTIHGMGTDREGKPIKSLNVEITAEQKDLDAYFAENADAIFTEPAYVLKRATLP